MKKGMVSATELNKAFSLIREHDELSSRLHAIDTTIWMRAFAGFGAVYIPKYFKAHELLPPELHRIYGDHGFQFLDSRILWTMDSIREFFGVPISVNNWFWGGPLINRGFRRGDSYVGASMSQHKFGRAIDFEVREVRSDYVRQLILENQNKDRRFMFITAMELGTPHVHIDCRNTGKDEIFTFGMEE